MIFFDVFTLPKHWASALINGDLTGYESDDLEAIRRFTEDMVKEYGKCWCLDVAEDGSQGDLGFMKYHLAQKYGIGACECAEYMFDIGN